MGLMSSLYVGASGLQVSQNALNTTGHNLANVETKGYVRQQTLLKSNTYNTVGQSYFSAMQTGRGVSTAIVMQVRDLFLDQSYRTELGRQGFYDSQYEAASEIEDLFGELEGVAFQNSLEGFWTTLQEISKEPDSLVAKATLAETSVSLMERAENIYEQLSSYQLSLNTKIETKVNRINEIGQEIHNLNDKIRFYESNNVENANDLRDQRNSLLDELGQIVDISYKEDTQGRVSVTIEETPFVTENNVYEMGTMTVMDLRKQQLGANYDPSKDSKSEYTNMLVPVWPAFKNMQVFNFDTLPSAEMDSDVGSLKGLLLARGTKVANYTNIPTAPSKADYTDEYGVLDEDAYAVATKQFGEEVKEYNLRLDSSIVMSTQAKFDQLIHGIITTINDVLCPNREVTVPAGTTVTLSNGDTYTYDKDTVIQILDEEKAPIASNGEAGIELFTRKSMPRYMDAQEITLDDGTTITARIYNEESDKDNYSLYTLGEIAINPRILEDATLLPMNSNDGTGAFDIETAEKLISSWQDPFATLDPNSITKYNFSDYYTAFTGSVATVGEKMNTLATTQQSMVNSIDNQRLSAIGVSSDEELTNLIKYQHAYNASSRYINVVSEMLEHIVTRL